MANFQRELGALADPFRDVDAVDIGNISNEILKECLRNMILIREAEVAIADLSTKQMTKTPCHLGIGQEGVAVGVCCQLSNKDRLYGTHRSHAQFLAMGCPVGELIAEVMGKATGCASGMGGSMHLVGLDNGFAGSVPIVGGTISIAVGAGLAAKLDGAAAVGVCFFGDGATEEGTFHESLNLAALYNVPILFVCENNLYSSHMDVVERQLSDRMARFAEAHKINTRVVDGNNVPAVINAAAELLTLARKGLGPGFLEAVTYRWRGHVGPDENIDVGVRRSQKDIDAWKKRDPIRRLKEALIKAGHLDEEEFSGINDDIRAKVENATREALSAGPPDPDQLFRLVYRGTSA